MARKLISPDVASKAMVGVGLSRLARTWREGEGCVLTFHGARADRGLPMMLDGDLHITESMFRSVCRHLADNYEVLPLSAISSAIRDRGVLPPQAIALTFDDGYASNYSLAFPILKEFGLPATIFVTTGFVDGTVKLWFNRLEMAIEKTASASIETRVGGTEYRLPLGTVEEKVEALRVLLAAVKAQPQDQLCAIVGDIERALGVGPLGYDSYPPQLRPLTWDQAREMRDSGLVDFGGHTVHHPILGRCDAAHAREEIFGSRDRMVEELGYQPTQFSYTNGKETDYTPTTQALVREAGYEAAYTMIPGFIRHGADIYALPRYGTPSSVAQAEATVSGTFEALHHMKQACRGAFAA